MQQLTCYNNRTPLNLNDKDLAKADKLLIKINESLEFFRIRLRDKPNKTDVHTHIGLFEAYLTDLAKLVDYESVLTEEREQRYKELREANTEIHRLNRLLGNGTSPDSVSSKLRLYDDVIRLWYGAHGFQYASLKEYTAFGITYDFNYELQYEADEGCSSRKEWGSIFQNAFDIIATKNSPFNIYHDTYHAELLDTDKNKQLIEELLFNNFPNYNIHSYQSRKNDFGSYSLRFVVNIPYQDIENLLRRIVPDYDNQEEKPCSQK